MRSRIAFFFAFIAFSHPFVLSYDNKTLLAQILDPEVPVFVGAVLALQANVTVRERVHLVGLADEFTV